MTRSDFSVSSHRPVSGDAQGERRFPLRSEQRRMWLEHMVNSDEPAAHNVGFAVRHRGSIDDGRLDAALRALVDRHEVLGASIRMVDGEPNHVVERDAVVPVARIAVEGASLEELREAAGEMLARPFVLDHGPLLRLARLERAPDDRVLVISSHHVITDMWSLATLSLELIEAYLGVEAPAHSARRRQQTFADFIDSERRYVDGPRGEDALEYWTAALSGAPEPARLTSRRRRFVGGGAGRVEYALDSDEADALRTFAADLGVVSSSVFLAAQYALLRRYTGSTDLTIGSTRANRSPRSLGTVGCLRNRVAWRVSLADDPSFPTLVRRVHDTVKASEPHTRFPLEDVAQALLAENGLDDAGLYSTTFQWNKTPRNVDSMFVVGGQLLDPGAVPVARMEFEPFDLGRRQSTVEIAFEVTEVGNRLVVAIDYAEDLYDRPAVEAMWGHMRGLLRAGMADAGALSALPMLAPAEIDAFARMDEASITARDLDRSLHSLVLDCVAAHPDRVAVTDARERRTYREIDRRSAAVAGRLASLGIGHGDIVGVHTGRTADLPVVLLGILRAGAAYIALDPTAPGPRLEVVAGDAHVAAVLTDRLLGFEPPTADGRPCPVVDVVRLLDSSRVTVTVTPAVAGDDPAYVSYTSGTTGRPKGVVVPHRAAVNVVEAMARRPGFATDDVLFAITDLSFDISLVELLLPLTVGGRVHVADHRIIGDADAVSEAVSASGATVIQATPSLWQMMRAAGYRGASHLRIWCGGEALPRDLAADLDRDNAEVWNLYGPTETTVWSSAWRVDPGAPITIGHALENNLLYVLDQDGQRLPVGVGGELYIGGDQVALGYLDRPELTATRFLPDPFRGRPDSVMYRTGDLALVRADGELELIGRIDDQIKVHGHRIEPEEVETALRSLDGVDDAAVVLSDSGHLVAFAVQRPDIAGADLRRQLAAFLPAYLVPDVIVPIGELPRTTSQKVDRRALRSHSATVAPVEYEPPRPGLETEMSGIWSDILGAGSVGRNDDFFALGGDSLDAVRLVVETERLTGLGLPISALIESPTIAQYVARIERSDPAQQRPGSVVAMSTGTGQPFFCVAAYLVTPVSLVHLAARMPDHPFYALQPQGAENDLDPHDSIEEMAAAYVEEIRRIQPVGPYALGGHCAGSWVALEIAHRLEDAGERVDTLVLIDSPAPGHAAAGGARVPRLLRRLRYYVRTGRIADAVAWQFRLVVARMRGLVGRDPVARRIMRLRRAHGAAGRSYRGASHTGEALLIISEQTATTETPQWEDGWSAHVSGRIETVVVPGAHASLVEPAPADIIGRAIMQAMR